MSNTEQRAFTPGPWIWAENYKGLYGAGPNNAVLDWFPYEGMHLIANADANARLIAAAPDLYEALQEMLVFHGSPKRDEWLSHEAWQQAVEVDKRARAALTRATTS